MTNEINITDIHMGFSDPVPTSRTFSAGNYICPVNL